MPRCLILAVRGNYENTESNLSRSLLTLQSPFDTGNQMSTTISLMAQIRADEHTKGDAKQKSIGHSCVCRLSGKALEVRYNI